MQVLKQEAGQLSSANPAGADLLRADAAQRTRRALAYAVLVSLLMTFLPWWWPAAAWLAWPQVMVGTLVHELGHGLAALVSGAGFESMRVYADGSGVAVTRVVGPGMQSAWIAAGGPGAPPLAALVLFLAARRDVTARGVLGLMAGLLVLALLLWVRNVFGACLVLACATLAGSVAWRASSLMAQAFTGFVAVQLCLATLSRIGGLFQSGARTAGGELASDTMQIAQALGGPHWFWGALLAVCSVAVLAAGLWVLWRSFSAEGAPNPGTRLR